MFLSSATSVNDTNGKFTAGVVEPMESFTIFHRYQRHQQYTRGKTYHRCCWHWWQICHQCHWYQHCTWFSKSSLNFQKNSQLLWCYFQGIGGRFVKKPEILWHCPSKRNFLKSEQQVLNHRLILPLHMHQYLRRAHIEILLLLPLLL